MKMAVTEFRKSGWAIADDLFCESTLDQRVRESCTTEQTESIKVL